MDPNLVKKTLPIALDDELPTSRAVFLFSRVARDSDHPDLAWEFAKANMKALLAKTDALGANQYAPSLFTFFSENSRADELQAYAKTNCPPQVRQKWQKRSMKFGFGQNSKNASQLELNPWIDKNGL